MEEKRKKEARKSVFNKKVFTTALVVIITMAAVVYSLFAYNIALRDDLIVSVQENLEEVTKQQKHNFVSKISADAKSIKNLAFMADSLDNDKEKVTKTIQELADNSNFEYIMIADTKGQALVSNGTVIDISKEEYFTKVASGETVICSPKKSQIRDAVIVPVSTPIYKNGSIVGVLAGSYTAEKLAELFFPSFGGKGEVYVTDAQGNILVEPHRGSSQTAENNAERNFYKGFEKTETVDGHGTPEEMKRSLLNGKSGQIMVMLDGSSRVVSYAPVGVNDWTIFVVVPESYAAASANVITGRAAVFAVIVMIAFLLFLLYTLFMQRRGRKERECHTRQLERLAYYDEITGLPNLTKFKMDVKEILVNHPKTPFVMARLDIVNFRVINEIFGFETGDKVVIAVADQIRLVRQKQVLLTGAVTRVNADEFILVDVADAGADDFIQRVELFEESFNKQIHYLLGDHRVNFRYSGYFLANGEMDVTGAIEKTNIAHHIAKTQGNKRICFYDEVFKQRVMRETELANQMEMALETEGFRVYLQPKYDLVSERVVGAEALVRWQTQRELLLPNEFIPLFERNGFIVKLDMYMFEHVCKLIRGWMEDEKPVVPVSVNFSRAHLSDSNFVARLEEIATRYGVPKKYLEIELTESTILDNEEVLEKLLNNLHSIGFKLSMDDFGIGYSSLGLLKNLPVDVIKIDRSFFVNNQYKTRAKTVIESIMSMTKKLHILTVAEGIESKEHIDLLREVGCDIIQGYYYAKPMPAEEFHDSKHRFIEAIDQPEKALFDMRRLGNLSVGRTALGADMPVSVYRLFQFTLRDVLDRTYGEGESAERFRAAGEMAGIAYAKEFFDLSVSFDDFIAQLKEALKNSKIGVLDIEEIDDGAHTMVLAVRDDLDCSGTPDLGKTICQYDEGFIAGVLYEYTKKEYIVREVDCWATGADVCRFYVSLK